MFPTASGFLILKRYKAWDDTSTTKGDSSVVINEAKPAGIIPINLH